MTMILFPIAIGVAGVLFFVCLFKAARFAQRHKDRLPGIVNRSTWWMRLFVTNGYGPDAEAERRVLAFRLAASCALFFAIAGAANFLFAPA
jgi:hypothetical protein